MDELNFKVTEIYESIQGESTLSGLPCTFIRLSGCPLRCRWCDTAYSFEGGSAYTVEQIISKVRELGPQLVELTGGEPMAQTGCSELCSALLAAGYKVMIETSGSYDIAVLPQEVHVVMDLKCPGSGMEEKNLYSNVSHLKPSDDVKFVVASYEDFLWAEAKIKEFRLEGRANILISPAFGLVKPHELVSWMLEVRSRARLNLQIHKYIWNPRQKGV